MGFVDKLKESYFKVEDKWFDLLDFIDSKNIPVYSVIDPIEKAGVPSLPLLIALILIASYFLLGGVITGTPIQEFTLSVTDATGQSLNAYVELMKGGEIAYSANVNGTALLSLPLGEYLLHASAFGCDDLDDYSLLVDPSSSEVSVTLNCEQQPLAKTVRVCFDPDDNLGNVNMKERGGSTTVNCNNGRTTCEVTVDATSDKKYSFKTSTDFVSDYYSGNELITMENNFECVKLFPYSDPNAEKGRVIVTAKNQEGQKVGGVIIQLVKPESSYVIDEKTTYSTGDNMGTAVFTPPVGTVFTVKAQPSNSTAVYEEDTIYNVTSTDTMFIDITLDPAAQTNITVLEETTTGTIGVAGASIMLYDSLSTRESQLGPFFTNSDGLASIGLEKEVEYNAVVYKPGYLKKEITIKGGEEKTVTLERALPNETGDLTAYVVFSDTQEAIPDVQVELYKDGKPVGIPSTGKTDYSGKTVFYSVPVGAGYCAKAIRPEGESECVDVNDDGEIKSTKYNEVVINIPRNEFELFIEVTVNGEKVPSQSKNQPKVTAIDTYTGEVVDSDTVNAVTGIVKLLIPEDTNVEIIGEYSDNTGYYTASKDLGDIETFIESNKGDPLTSLDLKKIENKVSIVSIEGDEKKTAGVMGEEGKTQKVNVKGKQYSLTLSIGTSNKTKWDDIRVTLSNEDNALEFLEPQSDYIDDSSGENTNNLVLNINPKKADGNNLEIIITFRVKTTAKTGETKITYYAEWEKKDKSIRDPTQNYKEENLNIVGCEAIQTQEGLSVCLEAQSNEVGVGGKTTLTVKITNEKQDFVKSSFGLLMDSEHYKLLFSDSPEASKEGEKITASIKSLEKTSDVVETEEIRLEHGESVTITAKAYAFETGDARIFVTKDNTPVTKQDTGEEVSKAITVIGSQPVVFEMQPSELYDLTNTIEITMKTSAGVLSKALDVNEWNGAVTVSGEALDCSGNEIIVDSSNTNNIITGRVWIVNSTTLAIGFDSSCNLKEGSITIKLDKDNAGGLAETTQTMTVNKAVRLPDTAATLFAPYADSTGRGIEVQETSGYPEIKITEDDKGYWTNAIFEFNPLVDYDDYEVSAASSLDLATITSNENQIMFKYSGSRKDSSTTGTITIILKVTKEKSTNNPNVEDIEKEYSTSIPVTVATLEQLEESRGEDYFTALKIASCTDTPNCVNEYCNIIQVFKYLHSNDYSGERNLKLVDSSWISPSNLLNAWEKATGKNVEKAGSISSMTGSYGVNSDPSKVSFAEGPGIYSFNLLFSNEKKFLSSISFNTNNGMVLAEMTQLLMPLPCETTLSDDLKSKTSTEVISKNQELKEEMQGVIKEMWSINDNQFDDNAYHKVVLVTCDPENIEQMNTGYCSYVNNLMGSNYGESYSAVIIPIREESQTLVIFAGKTWDDVEDLVNRFNNAVNGEAGGAQLVVIEVQADTAEGGTITLGTALVRPTKTVTYVCQEKQLSGDTAVVSDCSLTTVQESSLETVLKKVFALEKDYSEEEIRIVRKQSDEVADLNDLSIFIGLCADEDSCSAEGEDFLVPISDSYKAMGVEDSAFSVPEGGAFFVIGEGGNAPKYRAYAHNPDELTNLLNAYASGGTRAVGETIETISDLSECSGNSDSIGTIGGAEAMSTITLITVVENGVDKGINPLDMKAAITAKRDNFKSITPSSCSLYVEEDNTGTNYQGIKFVKINNECYIMPNESNAFLFQNSGSYSNVYFQCSVGRGTVAGDPININVVQGS